MSDCDDLRNILGEELFNELDSLDDFEIDLKPVNEKKLEHISQSEYKMSVVFKGEQALDLVSALFHAAEEGCKECESFLAQFSGQVISSMWIEIIRSEELMGESDEP